MRTDSRWSTGFCLAGALVSAVMAAPALAIDVADIAYRTHTGDTELDTLGWSVAGLGDVNGDGTRDYVIGATGYGPGPFFVGRAYVYSGANGNRIRELAAGSGIVDMAGWSVASAGDI